MWGELRALHATYGYPFEDDASYSDAKPKLNHIKPRTFAVTISPCELTIVPAMKHPSSIEIPRISVNWQIDYYK